MRPGVSYRLSMTSRIIAAALGGYVTTSLFTIVSSLLLQLGGMSRAEAILAPTIASFLIYAGIVIAVFHARNATWAWFWLAVISAGFGLMLALILTSGLGAA